MSSVLGESAVPNLQIESDSPQQAIGHTSDLQSCANLILMGKKPFKEDRASSRPAKDATSTKSVAVVQGVKNEGTLN